MNSPTIAIRSLRVLPGCASGLDEKTAVVELFWPQALENDRPAARGLAERTLRLLPEEVYWGEPVSVGLGAFLAVTASPDEPAACAVALVVGLQRWARDAVWRGKVLSTSGGVLRLALPYQRRPVLEDSLRLTLAHLAQWTAESQGEDVALKLAGNLESWVQSVQRGGLAPNTLRFFAAARRRAIPTYVRTGVLHLGWGRRKEMLDSTFTGHTSNIASRIARKKPMALEYLRAAGLPVPRSTVLSDASQALKLAGTWGWPLVVKPSNQDQGKGVFPGLRDEASLRQAFEAAAHYSPGAVILEQHVAGNDHRLLVVGQRMVSAIQRVHGGVVGDGLHTVEALMEQVNADPRRGTEHRSMMRKLILDEEAAACLRWQGLTAGSVVATGVTVQLRRTANISSGATAVDVTAKIHPHNCELAVRAANAVGLDIAGVDFICPDIARSWREVGGAICEINAQPGLRVHWLGHPERDINGEIVDWLFRGKTARIPTAGITGTSGRTPVARMLHHIWLHAGKRASVCTTQGVWLGREQITSEDLSGLPGGRLILENPQSDVAVIELPPRGLIRLGHPCDRYEVAAMLNVQDGQVAEDGIARPEQMALLMAQVLARASRAVVVNAQDPLCLAMLRHAHAPRHILVSCDSGLAPVLAHCAEGGAAFCLDEQDGQPWITLVLGQARQRVMPLHEIPATLQGALRVNESSVLFAVALAWAQGLRIEAIRAGLASYSCSGPEG